MLGVAAPEGEDFRVDFHGIDGAGLMAQSSGHVIARARTDNQDARVRRCETEG